MPKEFASPASSAGTVIEEHPALRPLAPVPPTGHIFDIRRRMGTVDMDERMCLRIDGIARQLQEAGVDHLFHVDAMDDHPHWIVRRTVIDVIRPIEWPAELRLRRWCSGLSPRWCNMRVRIDGDNGGLIETEGFWIHMNKQTMGPSRVADRFFELMSSTTAEHRLRWQQWLTDQLPSVAGTRFPLRRTDIDHFDHLTNTAYWHGVHESCAEAADLMAGPHRYILEYNKPVRFGEHVDIHTDRTADALTMWFAVDGDVRAIARMRALS
ncbi:MULTISPECIES: acyl-[acyl-carrier-protein] thioesterase [unclassified Nocardia]|uniref:acyl-[acyl-carrier-protein] thioesterase n=1 Tax=unclassified Nocardia TaxID=2637762 RepID=UPI001CE4789B|nr:MULTISPECIES: acyl-ACP thioesterase domain-containing protein [unclassified Nocardia]